MKNTIILNSNDSSYATSLLQSMINESMADIAPLKKITIRKVIKSKENLSKETVKKIDDLKKFKENNKNNLDYKKIIKDKNKEIQKMKDTDHFMSKNKMIREQTN